MATRSRTLAQYALAAGVFALAAWRVADGEDATQLWRVAAGGQLGVALAWATLGVSALLPLNLGFEAAKFRLLLPQARRVGWPEALARVCAGIAAGLATPWRVGDFAGRLARSRPAERAGTLGATALGSMLQWAPIATGGVLGWHALGRLAESGKADGSWAWLAAAVAAAVVALVWALPKLLAGLLRLRGEPDSRGDGASGVRAWARWAYAKTYHLGVATDQHLRAHPASRWRALALAYARYGVFALQLAWAFWWLGLNGSLATALAGVGVIVAAQTLLPLPAPVLAAARVELAVQVWGASAVNPAGIAAASGLVFVLNLALPALAGVLVIARPHADQAPA